MTMFRTKGGQTVAVTLANLAQCLFFINKDLLDHSLYCSLTYPLWLPLWYSGRIEWMHKD